MFFGFEYLQDKVDFLYVSGSEVDVVFLVFVDFFFLFLFVLYVFYDSCLLFDFFSVLVCDMLYFYVEQGDVQMVVFVFIIFGEWVCKDIDEQIQEYWYIFYIDLLQCFCFWNVFNEVVKLSISCIVSCFNQVFIILYVNCSYCKWFMSSWGWVCDRCYCCVSMCVVCYYVVKGLFVWCQGCSYGGYLQYIMKWLEGSFYCFVGCGYFCEYF